MKVILFSLLILFGIPAFGQTQFSADMTDADKQGGTTQSKVYVGAGKMRIDGQPGQPISIVDYQTQTAYILMPKEKMSMQMKMQDSHGQLPMSFALLAPTDPSNPCSQWKKMIPDLSCKKIGTDTLNSRTVDKWEGNRAHGEKGFLWFDTKLQFVVKIDAQDHLIEFKNIQEGPQPASLFRVPSDFHKMN